jgi:hypothetical protein
LGDASQSNFEMVLFKKSCGLHLQTVNAVPAFRLPHFQEKAVTRIYPSRTFPTVLAISPFVNGFITNPLMSATFAESASMRWLKPMQRTMNT